MNACHLARLSACAGAIVVAIATSTPAADPTGSAPSAAVPEVRVLVAYYSRHGTTEAMARGVAEGARRVKGVEVVLKKVDEVTKEDLQSADGIVLGSPTFYANIPGEMKTALDNWAWKMRVDLTDKVGGAFATGGDPTGGRGHVVVSLLLYMINNRMIVAGPLQQGKDRDDIWAELGASAVTGPTDPGVDDDELTGARRLGIRIATLARKLKPSPLPPAGEGRRAAAG